MNVDQSGHHRHEYQDEQNPKDAEPGGDGGMRRSGVPNRAASEPRRMMGPPRLSGRGDPNRSDASACPPPVNGSGAGRDRAHRPPVADEPEPTFELDTGADEAFTTLVVVVMPAMGALNDTAGS